MKRNHLITPEGTRDLLFEECLIKRRIENDLRAVFIGRGYSEVITPGVEFFDVFDQSSHYFPPETMYKLTDGGGRIMVMRPDSTMPIARLVATRLRDMVFPLKLFYNQNIFISNPKMAGRSDETTQAGIEIIGGDVKRSDIETLTIAIDALSACFGGDFRLEIGSIAFFKMFATRLNVYKDIEEAIRVCIENKNFPALKILLDELESFSPSLNEFGDCLKPDVAAIDVLRKLPSLFGGKEMFGEARKLFTDDVSSEELNELESMYNILCDLGYESKVTVDLGLVNRTDYYTGIVFRGYTSGFGDAVLSGGRYDRLIGEFGLQTPATGFAVNVDAVIKALIKRNKKDEIPQNPAAEVLVFSEEKYAVKAVKHCNELIKNGHIAEYSVISSFAEAGEYAAEKGISRIDIVGEDISQVLY